MGQEDIGLEESNHHLVRGGVDVDLALAVDGELLSEPLHHIVLPALDESYLIEGVERSILREIRTVEVVVEAVLLSRRSVRSPCRRGPPSP